MIGKIMLVLGGVAVLVGGLGGWLNDYQGMFYMGVPIGVLLLFAGSVQSLAGRD